MKYKKIVAYTGKAEHGQIVFQLNNGKYALVATWCEGAAVSEYAEQFYRFCPYLNTDVKGTPEDLITKCTEILNRAEIEE